MPDVEAILKIYKALESEQSQWVNIYNAVDMYCTPRESQHNWFATSERSPGAIQNGSVFDETAIKAAELLASAMVGATWPNGAKSIRIKAPYWLREVDEVTKRFYEWQTARLAEVIDHSQGGFVASLHEAFLDSAIFGICGIMPTSNFPGDAWHVKENDAKILFKSLDVKRMTVSEGSDGQIDSIYCRIKYTAAQAVDAFGYDKVSNAIKKAYDSADVTSTFDVLHVIRPRRDRDPAKMGVDNMPYASVHIEIAEKLLLRNSGFLSRPFAVSRFFKLVGEVRGRSPAMVAMPSILELNHLRAALILAAEFSVRPALMAYTDSIAGNGKLELSPGGVVELSPLARHVSSTNHRPIEVLSTTGDLTAAYARAQELSVIIYNAFYRDRLLDLNNTAQMTLGEAQIRDQLRGQLLNAVYARQYNELLYQTVAYCYTLLFVQGELGTTPNPDVEKISPDFPGATKYNALVKKGLQPVEIPERLVAAALSGLPMYEIEFISPAQRIRQSEELSGINSFLTLMLGATPLNQEIPLHLDVDAMLERVQQLTGAPSTVLKAADKVRAEVDQMRQAQAQAAQAEMDKSNSEAARNAGQAASALGAAMSGGGA